MASTIECCFRSYKRAVVINGQKPSSIGLEYSFNFLLCSIINVTRVAWSVPCLPVDRLNAVLFTLSIVFDRLAIDDEQIHHFSLAKPNHTYKRSAIIPGRLTSSSTIHTYLICLSNRKVIKTFQNFLHHSIVSNHFFLLLFVIVVVVIVRKCLMPSLR